MYCSRCGTWAPDSDTACPRCGMALAGTAPASGNAPAAPVAPVESAEPHAGVTWTHVPALRYGGFWRRFAAWVVDRLVLFFPLAIVRVLSGLPLDTFRTITEDQMGRFVLVVAISALIEWNYSARLESSRWQGTLGQQLLNLRVADAAGHRVTFARASGRYFGQYVSGLLCGLGYLFNLWTSHRQTLHDMIAGCVLVHREPVTAAATTALPTMGGDAS